METVAGVVAASRDTDGTAVAVPERTTDYSYGDFCTDVWKTGNLLRHYGVRAGAAVAVATGPKEGDGEAGFADAADPLLAVLGAGVVGASVDPDPSAAVAGRALVCPAAWVSRFDPEPGCSVVAYGGPPEAPSVVHFEQERWSENPTEPPDPAGPDSALLAGHPQGELVAAATRIAEDHGLGPGDRVAVRAPLTTPGAIVAGLLVPLRAGATAVMTGPDRRTADAEVTVGQDGDLDPTTILNPS